MATQAELDRLRRLISEPDDETPYSNIELGERIDALGASGSMLALAAEIWREKAAAAAELVDISEGGSSRKNGDLHQQALSMATALSSQATAETATPYTRGTVVSRVRR